MITEAQLEILHSYRTQFLETGEIHENVRPLIAKSWQRSTAYGVDPESRASISKYGFLTDNEVKALRAENRHLIKVAQPIMLRTADYIEGSQCVLTLHNKDGRVLSHIHVGCELPFHPFSQGLNVGMAWDEKVLGTCAPALCLKYDRDVQLVGAEHFSSHLCNLACTAAPIHSRDGEVIACINLLGDCTSLTPLTMILVKLLALLIQTCFISNELQYKLMNVLDMVPCGLVHLDEHFQILQANTQAASILQISQAAIQGMDFRTLFPKKEDIETQMAQAKAAFSFRDYELLSGERHITCNITISPLIDNGQRYGAVVTLEAVHRSHKPLSSDTGNHAKYCFDDIISQDNSILSLKKMLKRVCSIDHCILIEGESGTGKELFAHALHSESNRAAGPFISVNCGSLPRSLVESELFGYEKGAFTGARSGGCPGKFELADGGTIFLDEIGELPLEIQATLLRVLDNHCIRRIGGSTEKLLDVRVIAATNRNLYQEVKNGNFRSDLYFRISVLKYDLPPLRERGNDVFLLADRFLAQMNQDRAQDNKVFSQDFYDVLKRYSWPGNVRELYNVVARGFYVCISNTITVNELPQHILAEIAEKPASAASISYASISDNSVPSVGVKEFERQQIIDALNKCEGNAVRAGKLLGLSKSTIYRRIREYGIEIQR